MRATTPVPVWVFIVPGALLALLVLIAFVAGTVRAPSASASPRPAATSDLPSEGEVGFAWYESDRGHAVYIYDSKEALERDDARHRFAVFAGARLRMVGGSFLYKEVSVLDGHWLGRKGWLPKDATHRSRP